MKKAILSAVCLGMAAMGFVADAQSYCYFKNSQHWGNVSVWAWDANNGNTQLSAATAWPGETITATKEGYLYWETSKGTPTNIIFSNNGNSKTENLPFMNGYVYDCDGSYVPFTQGGGGDDPVNPDPVNPDPINPGGGVATSTTSLITDYYKVNPDGKVGQRRTVNVTGHPASNALSNWTADDLIAQGVARDVSQAYKGLHERPIVDSYSLYAAWDDANLYLGVQFVYTVWDAGGEGKQPGESKPYNMDGHIFWAFDLDPQASFDGYINGTGPIWNETYKGAKFNNGVDAVLMCSTKPGVGTPGLFIPTPDGHASYDAAYCKGLPKGFYGYVDGLHPSIEHIWGQPFGVQPDVLTGNTGFVDLRSEIADNAHTFYEFKIPLSVLGITTDYIAEKGIGVMYIDKYGTSPVGGTPYDPSYFDNVAGSYSLDKSTSKEKEDEDVITYAPARIGRLVAASAIDNIEAADTKTVSEFYNLQGMKVGRDRSQLAPGIYVERRGARATKILVK